MELPNRKRKETYRVPAAVGAKLRRRGNACNEEEDGVDHVEDEHDDRVDHK